VLIGTDSGYLKEFSLSKKRFMYHFGRTMQFKDAEIGDAFYEKDNAVALMAKTFDRRSFYVCGQVGHFKEFKTRNRKMITNDFGFEKNKVCTVTHNNEFLFIAEASSHSLISKFSLKTKQTVHTWNTKLDKFVMS